jgi:hypothetical protein
MKTLSICILTIGIICSTEGRLERIQEKPESPLISTLPQWSLDKSLKKIESGKLKVNFEDDEWTGKYSTYIEENKYHCSQGTFNFLLYFNSNGSLYDAKTEGRVVLKNADGIELTCDYEYTCTEVKRKGYCVGANDEYYKLLF